MLKLNRYLYSAIAGGIIIAIRIPVLFIAYIIQLKPRTLLGSFIKQRAVNNAVSRNG